MKTHRLSYSEITEKFLKLEDELNLLYFEIDGYLPWQMVRVKAYLEILDYYLTGTEAAPPRSHIEKIMQMARRVFINSIIYNPFFDFKKSDILIFESGRKYKAVEGKYIDIYTHYLAENLVQKGKSVSTYETYYHDKESIVKNANVKHLDFDHFISGIFTKISSYRIDSQYRKTIKTIEARFHKEFGFKQEFEKLFTEGIKKFKVQYKFYSFLFGVKKPEEIFIINSSVKAGLIAAAKNNNIIVSELQHGLNSNKEVIMNYPYTEKNSLAYFPHRFYVWNNVNQHFSTLPISDENIISFPNYHLQKTKDDFKDVKKELNTILIVSQPFNVEEIRSYLENNLKDLKDFEITYKIHPLEDRVSLDAFIAKVATYTNVRFVDNEESIYRLLQRSNYVIGIYSTALFEAEVFDSNIILLNLPGVEMAESLLKNPKNIKINPDSKLIDILHYKA